MALASDLLGWYDLNWKGGSFEICLRPAGMFFCPRFQAQARWELEAGVLKVDWKNFGKYEFAVHADKSMEGHAVPKNADDENNWRKATFKRPVTAEELVMIGDGAGTEWDFQWSGGSFPVQFKADGFNHFTCDDFPAHSHWSLEGSKITIDWDEYGKYELEVNVATKTMEGGLVGGDWKDDKDWRKAKLGRSLLNNRVLEEHYH